MLLYYFLQFKCICQGRSLRSSRKGVFTRCHIIIIINLVTFVIPDASLPFHRNKSYIGTEGEDDGGVGDEETKEHELFGLEVLS